MTEYTKTRHRRNGVRWTVTRGPNGSTVETTCGCYGLRGRVHTTLDCPNRPKAAA